MRARFSLLLMPLLGCRPDNNLTSTDTVDTDTPTVDEDGDGYNADEDCDDHDLTTYPGAEEVCGDQLVNDCDSTRSESLPDCAPLGTSSLADADARLIGATSDAQAGYAIAGAHDVNGDGIDDVLVGAPDAGSGSTATAYVAFGPVTGTVSLSLVDAKLTAEAADDETGFSVAGPGDVDGDGYADLLIGDPNGASGADDAGVSYLVLGPVSGNVSLGDADAKMLGELTDQRAGYSLAAAGDINGDDHPDLVIGAPFKGSLDGGNAGAAYVMLGPVAGPVELRLADTMIISEGPEHYVGFSVAGAGDTDGDGQDDLIIGTKGVGLAYLARGPMPEQVDLGDADARFESEAESDLAGTSVSGAGDCNGDGHSDLLVGATLEGTGGEAAGAAYLVFGPVTGTLNLGSADAKFVGEAAGSYAGSSVAGVGDVDGDALGDLLIGAPAASPDVVDPTGPGAAYLILGPATGTVLLVQASGRYEGEALGDNTGAAVAGAGDANGDGFQDLLIGAFGNDSDGSGSGAVYLLYGGGV